MSANFFRTIHNVVAVLVLLCMSACTGYDVIQASDQSAKPLEKNSLRILWKSGKFAVAVEKHQRASYGGPTITKEDNVLGMAKAELVKLNLQQNLIRDLSAGIGSYASQDRNAKYVMALELVRIVADTDGSRDVTITASLHQMPGAMTVWSRTIKVSAPRFSSDDAISAKVSDAIVGQMKSSDLIS